MTVESALESARAHYARRIVADVEDPAMERALIAAFARVPRERFLGPPPWRVYSPIGQLISLVDDPGKLYRDVLVVLSSERQINNGQPSLHAQCLAAAKPRAGDIAVQIGAGGGYYTAVLAELVGPEGFVHAYEVEADLAERAAQALAERPNVRVHGCSATATPLPAADVVYASCGASHPPDGWLDALQPGGRLIFPLTRDDGGGAMLLVERPARNDASDAPARHYAARFTVAVQFIGCAGARDPLQAERLAQAFAGRSTRQVRSLRRGTPPDASAWWTGTSTWLSTEAWDEARNET